MKYLLIYLFLNILLFSFGGAGKTVMDDPFSQGVLSFEKKNYAGAHAYFKQSIDLEPNNLSAYYNLAITDLELKKYGEAIWAFEKCLKLDPNNVRAGEGLKMAHVQLDPKYIHVAENKPASLFFAVLTPSTWGVIGVFCSVSAALMLFLHFTGKSSRRKGVTLTASVLFLILLSFSIYSGFKSHELRSVSDSGIVITPSKKYLIDLSPSDEYVNEGTKVFIKDSIAPSFLKVITPEGQEMILEQEFVKRI